MKTYRISTKVGSFLIEAETDNLARTKFNKLHKYTGRNKPLCILKTTEINPVTHEKV